MPRPIVASRVPCLLWPFSAVACCASRTSSRQSAYTRPRKRRRARRSSPTMSGMTGSREAIVAAPVTDFPLPAPPRVWSFAGSLLLSVRVVASWGPTIAWGAAVVKDGGCSPCGAGGPDSVAAVVGANRDEAVLLDERLEFLVEVEELGLVVLDVLVGPVGVPLRRQLGGLVHLDLCPLPRDVIRDLVARLIRPRRLERELLRGGGVAFLGLDLLQVGVQRLLEGLGLHEHLDGKAVAVESLQIAVGELRDLLPLPREEKQQHLLHPLSLEQLEAARPEAGPFDDQLPLRVEQRIILHLRV